MNIDDELRRAAHEHRAEVDRVTIPELPTRTRRSARFVAAAVAAVVVVGAVVGIAVTRSDGHVRVATEPASSTPSTTVPTASAARLRDAAVAGPILAPTFVPGGEQLWSVRSTPDTLDSGFPSQLFGTAASNGTLTPGLLLEYQPNPQGGSDAGPTPIQVRGTTGFVDAAKDAAGASSEIRWVEGNTSIVAIVRGASTARAVAVLDGLRPRNSDLLNGFDPTSAPADFGLLGERTTAQAAHTDVRTTFEYAGEKSAGPAPTATADIEVIADTNATYPGYLRTWIGGSRSPDGLMIEPDAYGPYQLVTVVWPDGRQVRVQATGLSPDTLLQIAMSAKPLTTAESQSLVDDVDARLAALPTIGTATDSTATVELHQADAWVAMCLRVDDTPVCSSNVSLLASSNGMAGDAELGTKWIVFAASPNGQPTVSPSSGPLDDTTAFPGSTAAVDAWRTTLVSVPATVDTVQAELPSSSSDWATVTFSRPPANP